MVMLVTIRKPCFEMFVTSPELINYEINYNLIDHNIMLCKCHYEVQYRMAIQWRSNWDLVVQKVVYKNICYT